MRYEIAGEVIQKSLKKGAQEIKNSRDGSTRLDPSRGAAWVGRALFDGQHAEVFARLNRDRARQKESCGPLAWPRWKESAYVERPKGRKSFRLALGSDPLRGGARVGRQSTCGESRYAIGGTMARVRNPEPTLDALFFSTPEQKVLKLLLSEPTSVFAPRAIASRLKGVRGMGGTDGLSKVLKTLCKLGFIDWVDNDRAVRLNEESPTVPLLKILLALSELETLKKLLEPCTRKGVLFGSRSNGKAHSESDYDLFVVTENPDEANAIAASHPLGKKLELLAWTPSQFETIERTDAALARKLSSGIQVWGSAW